jgi:DnaJ-class molecular chaperone
MTRRKIVECPECRGEGRVWRVTRHVYDSIHSEITPKCDGRGKVISNKRRDHAACE